MSDLKTIEDSRHYFRNCKAAFRLLQGALLSGKYNVSDDELKVLEQKFVHLENEYEKANEIINYYCANEDEESRSYCNLNSNYQKYISICRSNIFQKQLID